MRSHRILFACLSLLASLSASAQLVPVILSPRSQPLPGGAPAPDAQESVAQGQDAFAQPLDPNAEITGCGKGDWARAHPHHQLDEDPKVLQQLREVYNDTDLLNCNLDIELLKTTNPNITGSNTMTVKCLVDNLTEFSFMLRSNFTAVAKLNGSDTPAPLVSFGTYGRRVTLDRPYNAGEVFTVRVEYSGAASTVGVFGSIFITTSASGYSLSEPYYSATWWPVKDGDFAQPGDNADKFTVQVAVTAPSNFKTVSNGLLQGIDPLSGGRSKTRWASNYQIAPYLVCFCTRTMTLSTLTWNYTPAGGDPVSMPVELYTSQSSLNNIRQMLTTLSDLYGTYPFVKEKYCVYPFGFSGGMEHQTCTGQGAFSEWINVHELGHQWWGDNVTCRYWNDIWLNEGFATYTEALWQEFKTGTSNKTALASSMLSKKVSGTVYKYSVTNDGAIFDSGAYERGGWVLHMLRRLVGDEVFFHGILPTYRATYEGGAATTSDFAAICTSVTGTPMQYFFDQWVFGSNNPSYAYGFVPFTSGGQNYIRLVVYQTQPASYGAGGKFISPIDFRLGTLTTDPIVTINNTQRQQWYVIPVATPPASLTLDPNTWLLWQSRTAVAYTDGPAKILSASPAPGSSNTQLASTQYVLRFSEPVAIADADVVLTGPGGSIPVSVSYEPATWTATVTLAAPLPIGNYTLTVRDTVKTLTNIQLDGELLNPASASSLPSGDGIPGGAAVIAFSVHCTADINLDDQVTLEDFFAFFNAWDVQSAPADLDQDGSVELEDYFAFFASFDAGC